LIDDSRIIRHTIYIYDMNYIYIWYIYIYDIYIYIYIYDIYIYDIYHIIIAKSWSNLQTGHYKLHRNDGSSPEKKARCLHCGAPKIAFSWFISGWILWFMVDITIDNYGIHGVYKPTEGYLGGSDCKITADNRVVGRRIALSGWTGDSGPINEQSTNWESLNQKLSFNWNGHSVFNHIVRRPSMKTMSRTSNSQYGWMIVSMAIPGSDWLEVPTILSGLFFRPKFQGISPENMAWNMVLTYLQFRILEFPLRKGRSECCFTRNNDWPDLRDEKRPMSQRWWCYGEAIKGTKKHFSCGIPNETSTIRTPGLGR